MKVGLTAQTTIAASPAGVFRYLQDLKYHFLWNPHLQSIKPIIKLKKGASYQTISLLLGVQVEGNNVVTKFVPNKELEVENGTGSLIWHVNYKLATSGKLTIITCTTVITSDKQAFAFTKPVLKLLIRRELQTDLEALKIAIEQKLG